MPLRSTLLSVGTFAALATTSLVAGHRPQAMAAPLVARPTAAAPTARVEAREQVDDAIAAAVIGSITRQFDTSDVVVQLGTVHVRPASIQDRQVTGDGRLRIDGQGDWIPFRFAAMYDTASTEVTYPQLELGGGAGKTVAAGSSLATSLDQQITKALHDEFQSQPVKWTPNAVKATDVGRFVRIDGAGLVDFGAEGSTPAQVQGLYDAKAHRWVRVHYELGPGSEWSATTSGIASL
ncbi:hypothetical protein DWG18_05515 [Lysobacter sp. TY2-98]|uniref:hypothetical protein n=1 Tax=Lysobacter sp. TY2-98 TaxID=2290922 RepID=UPI000E2094F0|nr:hypothetical protein [Lysobacter sp. TY2-98]AXK71796.1 hypothetical protein DWG18_05515 [Lysobacter sp. TY2-98]